MYPNTTDIASLCPYTGLRSFTEDESIYFKGRDAQIDVVAEQLAARKFLMLTGASGDGKSSLVYAGLIPQARSGFFKARYSNWCVVDFRPERTPLTNLINAVSRSFLLDASSVETELKRGFSSLADIYQNSSLYVDEHELALASTDAARRQLKLGAANLLLIIDQFEEFFTNPENQTGDAPGVDAQIVVNLMLETTRIALERGLPIYVVFTMRSDYIGQCNSFRGLPEFIGYSQFFVPRLNRGELQQVIEEPAALNGNAISRRLTERLISDLSEGIDQLPILQHALRQIWLQAMEQNQEMDLIHYAMVGGLPADQLPDDDKIKFNSWVERLPENQRVLYSDAGLGRVIEIHARKLYDEATGRYLSMDGYTALDSRQIKRSIAIAFACLTRIDNGRAVRNRMSLGEIAAIINIPQVTPRVLAAILEIFRLPDNSFLRPFTFEVSGELSPDAVLDITHESLIRNWEMLHQWASQEFRYYTTFDDLAKQLRRWKESGMSNSYLIPIGPLTFFEKWYEECQPNAAWIQRYTGSKVVGASGREAGETMLRDMQRYLKQSARRVGASRLLVKYGARKVVGLFAVLVLAVALSYVGYRFYENQPSVVTKKVISEGRTLFVSPDVPNANKANYLVAEETRSTGEGFRLLTSGLPVVDRLTILWEACRLLYPSPSFHRSQIRNQIVSEFEKIFNAGETNDVDAAIALRARASFVQLLATENHFDQAAVPDEKLRQHAAALHDMIVGMCRSGMNADQTATFNESIQLWLSFGGATGEQIQQLIALLSPRIPESRFNDIYKPAALEINGYRSLNYGGGFHTLATLYAAIGDVPNLLWCFEQQLSSVEYFTDRLFNTRSNVIGFLYQFGHRNLVPEVIAWHTSHFPQVSAHQIYDDLVCRSAYLSEFDRLKFGYKNNETEGGTYSISLCLAPREQYDAITEDYEQAIGRLTDPAVREFLLAMHYKRLGLFSERYHRERGLTISDSLKYYKMAFAHFGNLAAVEREVEVTFPYYYVGEVRMRTSTRRQLFLYPDVLGNWQMSPHHGDSYFNYMAREGLLKSNYTSASDLRLIPTWITNLWNRRLALKTDVQTALDFVNNHPLGSQVDMNIARIMLARHYFIDNDTARGLEIARQINIPSLEASKQRMGLFENTVFLNELMGLCGRLAAAGHPGLASEMSKSFSPAAARIIAYLYCVEIADAQNRPDIALSMLDSATKLIIPIKSDPIPRALNYVPHYTNAAYAVGDNDHIALAEDLYRNSLDALRLVLRVRRMRGLAQRSKFHEAYETIPTTLTESQDMLCRTKLLEFFTSVNKLAETENEKMYHELTEGRLWLTGFFNN